MFGLLVLVPSGEKNEFCRLANLITRKGAKHTKNQTGAANYTVAAETNPLTFG